MAFHTFKGKYTLVSACHLMLYHTGLFVAHQIVPQEGGEKKKKNLHSLVLLLAIITYIHYLQDVVVGTELQSSHIDLDIIFQEVLSQLTNLFGPGSTPHQSLPVWLQEAQFKNNLIRWNKQLFLAKQAE